MITKLEKIQLKFVRNYLQNDKSVIFKVGNDFMKYIEDDNENYLFKTLIESKDITMNVLNIRVISTTDKTNLKIKYTMPIDPLCEQYMDIDLMRFDKLKIKENKLNNQYYFIKQDDKEFSDIYSIKLDDKDNISEIINYKNNTPITFSSYSIDEEKDTIIVKLNDNESITFNLYKDSNINSELIGLLDEYTMAQLYHEINKFNLSEKINFLNNNTKEEYKFILVDDAFNPIEFTEFNFEETPMVYFLASDREYDIQDIIFNYRYITIIVNEDVKFNLNYYKINIANTKEMIRWY